MSLKLSEELKSVVNQISDELDSDIFLFSAAISDSTADSFINKARDWENKKENVALIIATYGGDPDAAFRIARYLKRNYNKFTLFVFGYCKSAGTLLALGADEIVMSDLGELGPLDIQVLKDDDFRTSSGLDIQQSLYVIGAQAFDLFQAYFTNLLSSSEAAITTKTASEIASSMSVGLFSPISGQIDPLRLGEMNRLMRIAAAYGLRLNPQGEETIEYLISGYPSHSFVIDYEEAENLFDCVKKPTELEYILERSLFPVVRKPSQNIICNLLESDDEDSDNENQTITDESDISPDTDQQGSMERSV